MKDYMYGFEKLDIWKLSRELVLHIYKTTHTFPNEERFVLCNQLQRAIISVSSNIAEGSTRTSLKEQKHFIEISFGSLMEVYCQMIIALDLNYITEKEWMSIKTEIDILAIKITAFRKSINNRIDLS